MGKPFGKLTLDCERMWNDFINMVVRVGGGCNWLRFMSNDSL
jgi:hypothetical protein